MATAGVLAMSAVVEDYSAQPCKKLRKDEEPPIKTITSYFSPVSKNTEKVFSSPKSNITDYFKKSSPASEREQISNTSKPKCNPNKQTEAICDAPFPQSPVTGSVKAGGRVKKRGKRNNLSRKLSDLKPKSEFDKADKDDIIEIPENDNVCGSTGFMGSDTAALLAEICSNKEDLDEHNESESSISKATGSKSISVVTKTTPVGKNISAKARKCKNNKGKVLTNIGLEKHKELPMEQPLLISSMSLESKSTLGDSSLDVNVGETSHENDRIEIVSFEEFLKSQEEKTCGETKDSKCAEQDNESAISSELGNHGNTHHTSPKMMTVHAQVHLSTPVLDSHLQKNKTSKRIAAIFLKKKDGAKMADQSASDLEQTELIQKRKSNVVILEDELELAVLETENVEPAKQKCTAEERQSFMNAFRQPMEAGKTGGKKSIQKQKDSNEIFKEETLGQGVNKTEGEKPSETVCSAKKQVKIKHDKLVKSQKLKKKTREIKLNINVDPAGLSSTNEKKANMKKVKRLKKSNTSVEKVTETSVSTSTPRLRRSPRYHKLETLTIKSPETWLSETESPVQVSTPKVKIPCRKSDVYKAEVITEFAETQSPIRMRFTRLSIRRVGGRISVAEDDVFTPRNKKVSGSAKKLKKAKELIERAKVIQQNIAKSETPRRRSCRQHALSEKNKNASEDCIIVDETTPHKTAKSAQKTGKNKNLRSLNDVLGKRAKLTNKTISSGQKKLFEKQMKNSSIITIVDDSSLEASENSQDDEQFKSKREFLSSGLPDSLKRHIAKTAAIMEAYSLSSSSFHNVVHVQQKDDCILWNLGIPTCSRLNGINQLNDAVIDVCTLTLSLGEFTYMNAKPVIQIPSSLMNVRRQKFSESVREYLLEEIRSCNPQFPVKLFLKQCLKKQSDQLAIPETNKPDCPSTEKSKAANSVEMVSQAELSDIPGNVNRTKRKRKDSAIENSKRGKYINSSVDQKDPEYRSTQLQMTTRRQLSRTARKKQVCEEKEILQTTANQIEEKTTVSAVEDVLWTEKYQPQSSNELIGNADAIKKLYNWLKDWKLRAEKEEKNQLQKTEKDKQDTWDHGDFLDGSENEEESLCNTVLITGPSGVGKTAAVYACAIELGFKVFEVNASCQRSGRQILAQLKEATQSHQVDQQGVNANKPCFFNSHSTTKSPRKLSSPRKTFSPRKPPASPRGSGVKKGLAPKSLTNFFKVQAKQKNEVTAKKPEFPQAAAEFLMDIKDTEIKGFKNKLQVEERGHGSDDCQRKTATSLILFEEVDVIFDDDSGFLAAIKTFMTTTKRPVILTTTDPTFGLMFDGVLEEIKFTTPCLVNVASYLQVLCLAENLRTDAKDFVTFLTANNCDIRQSVLHLQFWAKSGGGNLMKNQSLLCGTESGAVSEDVKLISSSPNKGDVRELEHMDLPKCSTGFFENLIGLHNIVSPIEGLLSFVKSKSNHKEELHNILQLLTVFQMKKIHFVSSNLELLLPLPLRFQEPKDLLLPKNSDTVSVPVGVNIPVEDSPIKVSMKMKRRRKGVLNDSDLFDSDSNSEGLIGLSYSNLPNSHNENKIDTQVSNKVSNQNSQPTLEKKLTPAEQKSSNLVFHCLNTIAEFVDNMSYLDCYTFIDVKDQAELGKSESLNWTETKIKNGLCDGLRIENRDWWSTHSCSEVKAGIEALAFRKCYSTVSKAINTSLELCKDAGKDPTEELTLNVSQDRNVVSFGQPLTVAKMAENRLPIARNVFSNRSFIGLGNRQANVTEYLPALRCICRLEKLKEQGKTKRRFLHYFEGIHLELPKDSIKNLEADFP